VAKRRARQTAKRATAKEAGPVPLTPEQERFIDEYMIDYNGTRAYHVAYPAAAYTTCRTEASKLLAKPNIKQEISARRAVRQKRTSDTAYALINEARLIAYADPVHLFEEDGVTPRNMRAIPPETRRAIASVKVRRERVERRTIRANETTVELEVRHDIIEYKLNPKKVGLDKLWLHHGLNTELPPLDVILAALPPGLGEAVRAAIAGMVSSEPNSARGSSKRPG
jgi:hypothetical protein